MSRDGIPDPDEKIPCPFDNHDVPAKRMQYHLMKCRKNYPHVKCFICPFNACHVHLSKRELEKHISSCPQRALIEPMLTYEMLKRSGKQNETINKGYTDLPTYHKDSVVPQTEDWDEELDSLASRLGMHQDYYSQTRHKDIISQRSVNQNYSNGVEENKKQHQHLCQTQEYGISQPHPILQPTPRVSHPALSLAGVGRGQSFNSTDGGASHSNLNGMPFTTDGSSAAFSSGRGIGRGRGMPPPSMMRHTTIKPKLRNEESRINSTLDINSEDISLRQNPIKPTCDNLPLQKFNAITSQIFSVGVGRGRGRSTQDPVRRKYLVA